jgi:hypothetical protein
MSGWGAWACGCGGEVYVLSMSCVEAIYTDPIYLHVIVGNGYHR